MNDMYQVSQSPTLSWRLAILFGQNTRTYKFALGSALLAVADRGPGLVPIEVLAAEYAWAILQRPLNARQASGNSVYSAKDFLGVMEAERSQSLATGRPAQKLVESAVSNMPKMVMDKFHNLPGGARTKHLFYDLNLTRNRNGTFVEILPPLFALREATNTHTLEHELDARWTLVESAWISGVGQSMMRLGPILDDSGTRLLDRVRRAAVTGVRESLIGFQDGKCLYCGAEILEDFSNAHVDHVFPYSLNKRGIVTDLDLNAIWNLVVSCISCNLEKAGRLPTGEQVQLLELRNNAVVNSPYPLKRAIENLAGTSVSTRASFYGAVLKEGT